MSNSLLFLKLGGSLITDKSREQTALPGVLVRLAAEVAEALAARPELRLVLGHGSGSFGHAEAQRYGTRHGVRTAEQWLGYAAVAQAAARLNRLVFDALREAGVPALNVPPSASVVCHDGAIAEMALGPVEAGLAHGLVPLVWGDVALDDARGGTIVSTEEVFRFLALRFRPAEILLAGIERGVLTRWPDGELIPLITPGSIEALRPALRGSNAADVTGGMESKVLQMLAEAQATPGLSIRIFSGTEPGAVKAALLGQAEGGTAIRAEG